MKHIKLEKQLKLNKVTVAQLNNEEMSVVQGGVVIGTSLCFTELNCDE